MAGQSRTISTSPSFRSSCGDQPYWAGDSDNHLLDLRIRDLGVRIEGTGLEGHIERLRDELADRDLAFRPYFWLGAEFCVPDGTTGITLPFYLAHRRLIQLERRQMGTAEGETASECLRLLRHEAGHAIDNAFRLHRHKGYRQLFGNWTDPYPQYYCPNPRSRDYVLHLDRWYAQAHPAEDFAETFAVWLDPASRWRRRYDRWPALRKLEYVDGLMDRLADQRPAVSTRRHYTPVRRIWITLRDYYEAKKARYRSDGRRRIAL